MQPNDRSGLRSTVGGFEMRCSQEGELAQGDTTCVERAVQRELGNNIVYQNIGKHLTKTGQVTVRWELSRSQIFLGGIVLKNCQPQV